MPVAAAVYFGIAEALTNTVRHAGAHTVEISIEHAGGMLRATVTDDGVAAPTRLTAPAWPAWSAAGRVRRHPRGQQPARRPDHHRDRGSLRAVRSRPGPPGWRPLGRDELTP